MRLVGLACVPVKKVSRKGVWLRLGRWRRTTQSLDTYTVHSRKHGDVTLYGPAAYVNASSCASAVFRDDGDTWALVAKRPIRAQEVCAYYKSEGGVCKSGQKV